MKAMIWTGYGPPEVLRMGEVKKPTPKDGEVLIRICATTVTAADCELRAFRNFNALWLPLRLYIGLLRPSRIRILGQEIAGEIEAVGKDVTRFKAGDLVFGSTGLRLSANAEFICLPQTGMLGLKPANLSYDEAAVLPLGGLEAVHILKQANIQAGQQVLIVGAGGTIGTFAVQLARHLGAEVTGVDSSEKLDMLRSIGAMHVIDYTREDFTRNGQTYDVIFDAPGRSSFAHSERSLKPNGQYLSANPGSSGRVRSVRGSKAGGARYSSPTQQDLAYLCDLIEAGKIVPVIDRRYPLEQAAEAHRYVDSGRKKGNVVLTVDR